MSSNGIRRKESDTISACYKRVLSDLLAAARCPALPSNAVPAPYAADRYRSGTRYQRFTCTAEAVAMTVTRVSFRFRAERMHGVLPEGAPSSKERATKCISISV